MTNLTIFTLDSLIVAGYYAILALSLNVEYGYSGLIDFGKVAFFALGAYASSVIVLAGYGYVVGITAAAFVAGIGGLLIALPAIRVRGDYLAIITLVFAESIRIVLKNEDWLAGGVLGIRGIPPIIDMSAASYELNLIAHAAIVYGLFAVFVVITWMLVNSPFGRIMRAIREDETLASAFGKDVVKAKAVVFAVSSAMAGVAGALFAQYIGYIAPDMFIIAITLQVWLMSILGGPASIQGSLIGAFTVIAIQRGMRILKDFLAVPVDPNNLMFILTGILLILVVMFKPEGIVKEGRIKTVK